MPELDSNNLSENCQKGGVPSEDITEDAEVLTWLAESGLDSFAIDPSSLEALKDILTNTDPPANENSFPVDEVKMSVVPTSSSREPLTTRAVSELSGMDTVELNSGVVSYIPGTEKIPEGTVSSAFERHIVDQLNIQTSLLLEMQTRLTELAAKVDQLQQERGQFHSDGQASLQHDGSSLRRRNVQVAAAAAAPPREPEVPAPVPRAAALPNEGRMAPNLPEQESVLERMMVAIKELPNQLYNSRVGKIARVYWILQGHHVRWFDFGLIFKVFFMMAVLLTRTFSSSKQAGGRSDEEFLRLFLRLSALVLIGFLFMSGYFQFLYLFWKEDYMTRIWNGEEIDINDLARELPPRAARPPVPPPRARQDQAAQGDGAAQDGRAGWQNTIFGGGIVQRDPDNPEGFPGVVRDVVCLFASFFLSIFPMWRPEGIPRAPMQLPDQPPPDAHHPRHQPPMRGGDGPGRVRPPADVMEAADDDEDDAERDT